jgi:hypothetical protein
MAASDWRNERGNRTVHNKLMNLVKDCYAIKGSFFIEQKGQHSCNE